MSWSGLPARLESKIIPEPNSGCWLWIGAHSGKGYGAVRWEGSAKNAHRVVYKLLRGHVPDELVLDHFHCENRPCVNPEHVCPATDQENTLRGVTTIAHKYAVRTHCKNGHLLAGDNVGVESRSRARICKQCQKDQAPKHKEWRQKNRAKSVSYTIKWRNANRDKHNAARRALAARKRAAKNA